jgi:UDP-N-acetyl-D-mannosaminuronic acid dehydrogenase
VLPLLEGKSGLKCGVDFWLAYCPERLAPGNVLHDLTANTRLIGTYDLESAILAKTFFGLITKGELLTTSILLAEVAKLAENAFRYVNISFANELALICKQMSVDVEEVIRLANTHPRVNIHKPGCGAGGPCLSKDTHLLLNSTKSSKFRANLISAAIKLNNEMPRYVVDIAVEALNRIGKDAADSKIVVFGTAYKGGVNDSRGSPSEGIIRELKRRQARIVVFDPNCDESFGELKAKNLKEAVEGADCIIIATDHKEFCDLNLVDVKRLMKKNPIIVDGKRIISPAIARSLGFEYVALSSVIENSKRFC